MSFWHILGAFVITMIVIYALERKGFFKDDDDKRE